MLGREASSTSGSAAVTGHGRCWYGTGRLTLPTLHCQLFTLLHCSPPQSEADGLLLLGRLLRAWAATPFEFTASGQVLLDLASLFSPPMKVRDDDSPPDSRGGCCNCALQSRLYLVISRCSPAPAP